MFGKKGGADLASAIREGRFALDEMQGVITDTATDIERTASETDDAAERMTQALSDIKLAFEPVGTAAFKMASDAASAFTQFVRDAKESGDKLQPILEIYRKLFELSSVGQAQRMGDLLGGIGADLAAKSEELRRSELINSGGVNISRGEAEDNLRAARESLRVYQEMQDAAETMADAADAPGGDDSAATARVRAGAGNGRRRVAVRGGGVEVGAAERL